MANCNGMFAICKLRLRGMAHLALAQELKAPPALLAAGRDSRTPQRALPLATGLRPRRRSEHATAPRSRGAAQFDAPRRLGQQFASVAGHHPGGPFQQQLAYIIEPHDPAS
jgi:hypothetical protein